jgi:hypothetical protein
MDTMIPVNHSFTVTTHKEPALVTSGPEELIHHRTSSGCHDDSAS